MILFDALLKNYMIRFDVCIDISCLYALHYIRKDIKSQQNIPNQITSPPFKGQPERITTTHMLLKKEIQSNDP